MREALSTLRFAAASGGRDGDAELLALAETASAEAKELLSSCPATPTWGARADAALVTVALARDDAAGAAQHARAIVGALQGARQEDRTSISSFPSPRRSPPAGRRRSGSGSSRSSDPRPR